MAAVKITLAGEVLEYDRDAPHTMDEAEAIEDALGMPYAIWRDRLGQGRAKPMAALAWLIYRRNGRTMSFEELIAPDSGFSIGEFINEIIRTSTPEPEDEPDPTLPGRSAPDGSPLGDQAGTDTTPNGTQPSSPRSTTSGRGKSGS